MMKKRVNLWVIFVFLYYLFVCNTIYHFITVELRLLLYIAWVSILYRLCSFVSFYTNDKNNILGWEEKVGKWVGKMGKWGKRHLMVAEAKVEFAKKYRKIISISREEKEEVLSAKKEREGGDQQHFSRSFWCDGRFEKMMIMIQ